MLKVRDNVDLKELEKFGFIYYEDKDFKEYRREIDCSERLEVEKETRIIHLYIDDEYYCCWTGSKTFDLIYDLIQAGIVEKVSD